MKNQLIIALLLALFGTPIPVRAAQETKFRAPVAGVAINVSGTGEIMMMPDVARITVNVRTRGSESVQTASENTQRTNAVLKTIKALGVAEKDIQTTGYYAGPQFDNPKQPTVLTDYLVNNSIRITIRRISDAGKVLDAAVKEGASVTGRISFELSNPQKAQDEALERALADATRKATLLAKTAGATRPLRLIELTESTDRLYPSAWANSVSDNATVGTPIQIGEIKITAAVAARFSIPAAN